MVDWEQVKRRDEEQNVNTQERSKIVRDSFFLLIPDLLMTLIAVFFFFFFFCGVRVGDFFIF
jgi:hypothetical protein